jgi:hypothetical protein
MQGSQLWKLDATTREYFVLRSIRYWNTHFVHTGSNRTAYALSHAQKYQGSCTGKISRPVMGVHSFVDGILQFSASQM